MSQIPTVQDVLDPDVAVLPLPDVAEHLDQPITSIHQLLRDGHLLAVRRDRIPMVPAAFLAEDEPALAKGVSGTMTVLRDGGFTDEEILRWLFTADETLPGRPIDALRENRGREVKRRAQAMGF